MNKHTDGNALPMAQNDQPARYAIFIEERKVLVETAKEVSIQYSKSLMALSGGALALSLTFIKEVAPSPKATHLLVVAWVALLLSLSSIACTLFLAQFAFLKQIDVAQNALLGGKTISNRFTAWIKALGALSFMMFVIGLCFTLWFSAVNLWTG